MLPDGNISIPSLTDSKIGKQIKCISYMPLGSLFFCRKQCKACPQTLYSFKLEIGSILCSCSLFSTGEHPVIFFLEKKIQKKKLKLVQLLLW